MQEIIKYAHLFLQKFCTGNQENQALLHKNLSLFLNPGVRLRSLFSSAPLQWWSDAC